ncbi:MAG: hypothetical protein K8M05_24460 [Deltaproteobacteria bacterium]|nr:hypothetical protein [Kofleriaceae bacterium]
MRSATTTALSAGCLLVAGACATTHQSARVLEPGKTQVTAALGRTSADEGGLDEGIWSGDLQVHTGLADKIEGGARLVRTPGSGGTLSYGAVEGRFQIVPDLVSIALPFGLLWAEEGADFDDGFFLATPTVFVGSQLSPTLELVAAPKLYVFIPTDDEGDTEVELGGSVGARFTNPARTWAIHPELGLLRIGGDDSVTYITFGLGVSVGN